MAAGVEERADAAGAFAHDDDRLAAERRGEEIVRRRDLAVEPDEKPGSLEDVFHLEREDGGIVEDIAPHPEDAGIRAVIDQRLNVEAGQVHAHCSKAASVLGRKAP